MRLIDADELTDKISDRKYKITKLKGGYRYCNLEEKNDWDVLDEFESMVEDVSTVDAELIVRCKDCVHRRKGDGWCSAIANFVDNDEFYCADGVKEYEDLH